MIETESRITLKWKVKLKSKLKQASLIELEKEFKIENSALELLFLLPQSSFRTYY